MKLFLIYRLLKKIASYQQNDHNNKCFNQKKFKLFINIFLTSTWIDSICKQEDIFSPLQLTNVKEYFSNFHKKDLEKLLNIIEREGMLIGDCIISPQFSQKCQSVVKDSEALMHEFDDPLDIKILLVILFNIRHFEFSKHNETIKLLRPLPWCSHHLFSFSDQFIPNNPKSLCLNPFHWALLIPSSNLFVIFNYNL